MYRTPKMNVVTLTALVMVAVAAAVTASSSAPPEAPHVRASRDAPLLSVGEFYATVAASEELDRVRSALREHQATLANLMKRLEAVDVRGLQALAPTPPPTPTPAPTSTPPEPVPVSASAEMERQRAQVAAAAAARALQLVAPLATLEYTSLDADAVGEYVSSASRFPWYAFVTVDATPVRRCGGALVSSLIVLVPANCLYAPAPAADDSHEEEPSLAAAESFPVQATVLLGSTSSDPARALVALTVPEDQFRVHPRYEPTPNGTNHLRYNLAALELPRAVHFSSVLSPVALGQSLPETDLLLVGYGRSVVTGLPLGRLRAHSVRAATYGQCTRAYGQILCDHAVATVGRVTAQASLLQTENGAPLVHARPASWWSAAGKPSLVGLGHFVGRGSIATGGSFSQPDGYVPVMEHRRWIAEQIDEAQSAWDVSSRSL